MNQKKQKNKLKGFSFLEMSISIFIFSLVIVMVVSVFVNFVMVRKKSTEIQRNMEAVSTSLDLMAKNVRMSNHLESFTTGGGDEAIRMYNNSQGICIYYRFHDGSLQIGQEPLDDPNDPSSCPDEASVNNSITADNIEDGEFQVTSTDDTAGGEVIGRMTIKLKISEQIIQTTVSFRDYDGIF